MSDTDTNNSDKPKLPNNLFSLLFEFLILLARGLRRQTFIFVLAMGALIILAFLISQKIGSFVPMYVIVASLIVLTFMALWAESVSKNKPSDVKLQDTPKSLSSPNRKTQYPRNIGKMTMSQFDKLRDWLDKLVDIEFRDMMNSLLTAQEITRLPRPLDVIDRGAFLGQMKFYDRLDEIEKYLHQKYPERFK